MDALLRPRNRPTLLISIALIALVSAWVMASRPLSAPDETAHYLRALNIANGRLFGPKAPNALLAAQGPVSPLGRRWEAANSRAVIVPASLSPPRARCLNGRPDRHGSCVESTYVGNYQPLPYLLPAVVLSVSRHYTSASYLSRFAAALPSVAFLLMALLALWDGSLTSLTGLALAITPMVLFVASVLSPNGLEITASMAFLAALLRLRRERPSTHGGIWVAAAAVSGSATLLAWQLGPLFVATDLGVFASYAGRGRLRDGPDGRHAGAMLAAALLAALALWLVLATTGSANNGVVKLRRLGDLHGALDQLIPILRQSVGEFGALTIKLPSFVQDLWLALTGATVAIALRLGGRRDRAVLLGVLALTALVPVLFDALIYRHTGFALQGRYFLPLFAAVALVAGEIIHARRGATNRRLDDACAAVILAGVAALQLVGWWTNAQANAGRPRAALFQNTAHWSPPLGWWPWTVLALAAVALLLAAAGLASRSARPAGLSQGT